MNLFPGKSFSLVWFFETVSDKISTDVGICYVGHAGGPPKRRCCIRRHRFYSLLLVSSVSLSRDDTITLLAVLCADLVSLVGLVLAQINLLSHKLIVRVNLTELDGNLVLFFK
jgi:hypothetical protein